MSRTGYLSNRGIASASRSSVPWQPGFAPSHRILLILLTCLVIGASGLQAYPVNYAVNGTFGAVQNGGPDVLALANTSFSITGKIDSTAPSSPSPCGSSCTYTAARLDITIKPFTVTAFAVPVTFATGSPGTISIAANIAGVPFTAVVKVKLTSAVPSAFGAESIVTAGSSVSYGTPSTVLAIASGTVSATTTAPAMSAAPTSLSFSYQSGGSAPPGQTLTISAASAVTFSAAAATSWVTLSSTSGATGTSSATLTVSVDPTKLSTTNLGTYNSSVTITSSQATNSPLTIPVVLTVTGSANLTVNPGSLSFLFQAGGSIPASQSVSVGSSGPALNFTAAASTNAGGNWLMVQPGSGTTPASLTVSVNPASLAPNTYSGVITLTAGATGSVQSVQVNLTITSATSLSAAPGSLSFGVQAGGSAPPAQTIAVGVSSGPALSFAATPSTLSGGNWLAVSPAGGTTPASLTVSVNPAGLTPNTYNGSITITPSAAGNGPLIVPVVFTVFGPSGLVAAPSSLSFGFQIGGAPPGALNVTVGSNGAPLNFTVAVSNASGGHWLSAFPLSGATPANIIVSADPTGLTPNTYTGSIVITPAGGGNPVTVPVSLSVTTAPALVVPASSLAFAFQIGGAAPGSRSVALSSTGAAVGIATAAATYSGGPWLTVSPGTATTPVSLVVSVNPAGLAANTYTGYVSISAPGATNSYVSLMVTLSVTTSPALAAAPNSLAFTAQAGGASPAAQSVDLASTSASMSFTASAGTDSGAPWLSVSPASGSAPGSLSVAVNPAGLGPGTYSGSIRVMPGGASSPLIIPVSLTVTGKAPVIQAITDAGSLASAPLAPMSIFTVWGDAFGPEERATVRFTPSGLVDTTLADTQVWFNGAPAPLLMVQAKQINGVVPNSVAGLAAAKVQVVRQGVKSTEFEVQIVDAAPALFTLDDSGKGQGAILNQDGTVNSAANPADKGSIVVLYGDGAGETNPRGIDGAITPLILAQIPKFVLPVSVQFGGIDAQALYAGPAPGQVAGLMQINARIPAGVQSGAVPVTFRVGGAFSQAGVTLAVR